MTKVLALVALLAFQLPALAYTGTATSSITNVKLQTTDLLPTDAHLPTFTHTFARSYSFTSLNFDFQTVEADGFMVDTFLERTGYAHVYGRTTGSSVTAGMTDFAAPLNLGTRGLAGSVVRGLLAPFTSITLSGDYVLSTVLDTAPRFPPPKASAFFYIANDHRTIEEIIARGTETLDGSVELTYVNNTSAFVSLQIVVQAVAETDTRTIPEPSSAALAAAGLAALAALARRRRS